jgi:Tol biopolymer transport system component
MGADGADQRRLTSDEVIQTDPAASPVDGTVAFSKWQEVAGEPGVFDLGLFSIGPDGTGLRTLAPISPDRDAINPIWSPDGTKIVFEVASASPPARPGSSDRQSDLAVMNSDGTGVRRLT